MAGLFFWGVKKALPCFPFKKISILESCINYTHIYCKMIGPEFILRTYNTWNFQSSRFTVHAFVGHWIFAKSLEIVYSDSINQKKDWLERKTFFALAICCIRSSFHNFLSFHNFIFILEQPYCQTMWLREAFITLNQNLTTILTS